MESFFNLLAKILPLISFYPRWTQMLFVFTFGLCLSSVAAFVILYSSASNQKQAADAATAEEKLSADDLRDITASLKELDGLYSDLGSALSAYYTSAASLRLDLLDYTTAHPDVQSYVSEPLPDTLRRDVVDVTSKLAAMRSALSAIQRNSFSAACWIRAARSLPHSALAQIRDSLLQHGFTETEATIDASDLSSLSQFIALAERREAESTFGPLLTATLATNSADIPGVGKGYDNASLRTFVFGGNIIFGFVTPSKKNPQTAVVASWGSAILLDIYRCMPDAELVRAELAGRYPASARAIGRMNFAVTALRSLSSDFRNAAADLEQKRGLLFLELPPKKH